MINNSNSYLLPDGWPSAKTTYIYEVTPSCDHKGKYKDCGVCSECGFVFDWESTFTDSTMGVYKIVKSFTPRTDKPYDAATSANFCTVEGMTVNVLGSYKNAYENKWYKYQSGSDVYYIFEDYLEFVEPFAQQISCTITSPAEGETVPKEAFPVKGTVTSRYPLQKVEAYIDGSRYATVVMDGKSSKLELQGTDINYDLDFAGLSSGKHQLVIKAYDIHRSSAVTVCTRNFTTAGTSSCSHSYSSKVTTEPTCGTEGVRTYTCSKCGSSYTESIVALEHSFIVAGGLSPTCTKGGYHTVVCSRCDAQYEEKTAALGHNYQDGYCAKCNEKDPNFDFSCGNNLTWEIVDGVLTISGTGAMYDYVTGASHIPNTPWFNVSEDITEIVIGSGVTSIGNNAFTYCPNLSRVTISESVNRIGQYAFNNNQLKSVAIPDSTLLIGSYAFQNCKALTYSYKY
mgnify:CR=1 FL=1